MEEVILSLRKIQNELEEHKNMISKCTEKVTKDVTENINQMMDDKLQLWDAKIENIKQRVDNQDRRLYYLEKEARQRNIVFFGLKEDEKSYSNLEKNILQFLHKYFSVNLDSRDLQAIRRIGKKNDKPRPVVITFTSLGLKINIYKQKGALKDTEYYMKEDYPQQILEKRKELQTEVRIEREKGNRAIIKYDKLVIFKNKPESSTVNKKRVLSNSPENYLNSQIEHKTQTTKKNKTLATHSAQRSSSFSEGAVKPGMLNFLVSKNTPFKQNDSDKNK